MKMKKVNLIRNGFQLRALICEKCKQKIIHPQDEEEYKNFLNLKGKIFKVKMRIVGNSYAVSIPKEIVDFIKEQERIMNDIVQVAFNDARKLSLMFGEDERVQTDRIGEREEQFRTSREKLRHVEEFAEKEEEEDVREIARKKIKKQI